MYKCQTTKIVRTNYQHYSTTYENYVVELNMLEYKFRAFELNMIN